MNPINWWNNIWFRNASYIDLAVIRIFAVGLTLTLLMVFFPYDLQVKLDMPDSLYSPLPTLKLFMLPWGWGARPNANLINITYWLAIVSGGFSLVGYRTNISLFIFAICTLFLQSFIYGFGEIHHREGIMMIALLVLSLSPSGRVLSLDNVLGKGHNSFVDSSTPASNGSSPFAYWPIFLLQAFFSLMYLSAVVSKMYGPGDEWMNGFTLQYYMIQDGIRWDGELALWLSQFHTLIFFAQIVVVTLQATFWIILVYPKAKWVYVPLGLFFHLFILFSLQAPFYQWIILYSVFIPWSRVFEHFNLKLGTFNAASI